MPTDPYYFGCLEKRRGTHTKVNPYRRDDIFCHQTGCAFTALFRAHLKVEGIAESIRQRLAHNPMFNANDAFRSLDMNKSGLVSRDEIRLFLET